MSALATGVEKGEGEGAGEGQRAKEEAGTGKLEEEEKVEEGQVTGGDARSDHNEEEEEDDDDYPPSLLEDMLEVDIQEEEGGDDEETKEEAKGGQQKEDAKKLLDSLLIEAASEDPYSVLEGHQSKEEEEKKKGKEDDEGDVVAVIDDGDCKKERKSKKRFRGDQDGDDGENWMPEGERAAKRRKEAAAEAALTNDQRIIRENLSRPFPSYSFETRQRLASECVAFRPKLKIRDVAKSGDSAVQKHFSVASRRLAVRRAYESKVRQAQQRSMQRRGEQGGVRRTYVLEDAAAAAAATATAAGTDKPQPYRFTAAPAPPAPPPPLPATTHRDLPREKPRLSRPMPKAVERKPIPRSQEMADACSHVKVNPKALEDVLSRLAHYQDQIDRLRAIVRESFAGVDDEENVDGYGEQVFGGHILEENGVGGGAGGEQGNKKVDQKDLEAMLAHLPRPEHQHGSRLHNNRGFRLVDLSVLRAALEKAQECPCSRHGGRLSIAEVDPNKVQEDLVTQLALRCSLCNKATIFVTSPFCEKYPNNFTANKELLTLLGPEAFFKLAKYVQWYHTASFIQRRPNQPFQMIMSLDTARKDPITAPGQVVVEQQPEPPPPPPPQMPMAVPIRPPPTKPKPVSSMSSMFKIRTPATSMLKNIVAPTVASAPAFRPRPSLPLPSNLPSAPVSNTTPAPSLPPPPPGPSISSLLRPERPSASGSPVLGLKGSSELPIGAMVSSLPPGTPIRSGADIRFSTASRTGLPKGVYQVTHRELGQWVVCVRDDDSSAGLAATCSSQLPTAPTQVTPANTNGSAGASRIVKVALPGPSGSRVLKVMTMRQLNEMKAASARTRAIAGAASATTNDETDEPSVDPLAI